MIRLGIVGTGGMAHAHAAEYAKIKSCKLVAVSDVDKERAAAFAERFGVASVFSDFKELLSKGGVDAVAIVTPDASHALLALQAIAAGKHVLCEKPLATNYTDATRMAKAAVKKGIIHMVNFSYRNSPAIQKAHELCASGKLGNIVHIEASYLQSWLPTKIWGDWKTLPAWLWRLSTKHGSKGVLGDVGVHIIDFASYPAGDIRSVQARLKTFTALKGKKQGEYPLDANDSVIMSVEFANGALGTIHTTRWGTGHGNSLNLSIHGDKGALRIDLDKSFSQLETCTGADIHKAVWKTIDCKPTPTIYQRFIKSIQTGKNDQPDFIRGAKIQKVLDACFTSDKLGKVVKV